MTTVEYLHPDGVQDRSRVVVLISGTGTLLAALLAATRAASHPVQVVAVGADRPCTGLQHAVDAGVPTFTVARSDHSSRPEWDSALAAGVRAHQPDLVVLAGFMRVLGPGFLDTAPLVLNTHPSLLPSFPGAHAVADALAHGVRVSGVTVHVVDAGLDTGPILAQQAVGVLDGDTEETLHERIKVVERGLLVDVVSAVAVRGVTLDGRKAYIP